MGDDVQFLLNQAEQAIRSVEQPVDVGIPGLAPFELKDLGGAPASGDKATLEVKNSYGMWETVPFVKEDGEWKIDKKGYADQMLQDIEQRDKNLDDIINRGRQP